MGVLVLVGHTLIAALFLGSALAHRIKTQRGPDTAVSRGVPAALPAAFGSGLLLLADGLGVRLGIWAGLGALLLVVFLALLPC